MEITTTSRHFKLEPELKEHAEKRIAKLSKYFDSIQEAHLVLAQQKYRNLAELTLHATGMDLVSREENPDLLTSIDKVVDRMERQIKKHTDRLRRRKASRMVPLGAIIDEVELPEIEPEDEYSPVVVRSNHVAPGTISVEDAIRYMKEKDWDFLLFSNSRSGRPALLHHREDGNYGLVEHEG